MHNSDYMNDSRGVHWRDGYDNHLAFNGNTYEPYETESSSVGSSETNSEDKEIRLVDGGLSK